jgi:hypothetical protein
VADIEARQNEKAGRRGLRIVVDEMRICKVEILDAPSGLPVVRAILPPA